MGRRAFEKVKRTAAVLTITSMVMGITITSMGSINVRAVERIVQNKRNVMYYGDWSIWGGEENFYPKDIPADQLTHLNLAFLDFNASGDLIFCDKDAAIGAPVGMPNVQWGGANAGIINALQDLRAENPNMKIGISIGGWSKSGDFSVVAADSTIRDKFVENVMKFVEYTNMDFVDLDWEYPGDARKPDKVDNKNDEGTPDAKPEDKENYIKLLQDLRTALDKQGKELGKPYELSVALPVSKNKLDLGIDIDKLFNIVDFANIMTYDMYGGWSETSGHHAALYPNHNDPTKGQGLSVDESIDYIISQGAEKEKIVVGAAYYTRGWEKVSAGPDASTPGLYGKAEKVNKDADLTPTTGANNQAPVVVGDGGRRGGVWAYRGLDKLKAAYPGLKEYWDDTAKAPYLYDENTGAFFTYDNVRSIGEKTKYVNDNELGGMIAWMASQDKPTTSTKRDELTKASKKGLYGEADLPDNKIVYEDLDITSSIKVYKEEWVKGGKYEITLKNNEKLEESGEVLRGVENAAESIKTPKLYIKNTGGTLTAGDSMAGKVTKEGDYTVVDISSVYEGGVIEPGKSYTFVLSTTSETPLATDISSIEIAQHIYKGGSELNRQLIHGNTGGETNTAPVFSGIQNKEIKVQDAFDAKAGVKANDKEDGDLTSKIVIEGSVDSSKAGSYKLTYTVTDSKGVTTTKDRTITVVDKDIPVENTPPIIEGAINKVIEVGDKFDINDGVTAKDNEDGDITKNIKVEGTVNTSKAGYYKLIYSVTDSKGLKTVVEITIIVTEDIIETILPWSREYAQTKGYAPGSKVTHKGKIYIQSLNVTSWYTEPGTGGINEWKLLGDDPSYVEPSIEAWSSLIQSSKGYPVGSKVTHNGKTYIQNGLGTVWYGEPGTAAGDVWWKLVV